MNEIAPQKLDRMLKTARLMAMMFWAGVFLLISACFDGSPLWAFFCVLCGWIGLVLGGSAGMLWADQLLGRAPQHRQVSQRSAMVGAIFTFWIPSLAIAVFGMALAGALPDSLKPLGYSDSPAPVMFQSLIFFLIYGGYTWITAAKEIDQYRTAQQTN